MTARRFRIRRDIVWQALFLAAVIGMGTLVVHTASENLSRLSIRSGYGFLWDKAPFELGESLIPYRAGDTYFRAFLVGILNTLKVALLGIVLSTVIGTAIAIGQLSQSVVVARACRFYIETVRNVPLLLQLIFWHTVITRGLPPVRRALSPVEGIYLSNRGLFVPALGAHPAYGQMFVGLLAGIGAAALIGWLSIRRRRLTGAGLPWPGLMGLAAIVCLPLAVFLAHGAPVVLDTPALKGFNFTGGASVSPEFAAVLLGLTLYTASFNAEIIRAGILGVPSGQMEAGRALGLRRGRIMRLVILPQAMRIAIPPLTNSYLNLIKESSLSVAIGYPEVVRVANITLSETNQSIECVSIIVAVYLCFSLVTALIGNRVNRAAALVER